MGSVGTDTVLASKPELSSDMSAAINREGSATSGLLSTQDLRDIWCWNAKVPEALNTCVHELIAATARRQPEAEAIDAWDGRLSYSELESYSTQLAHHLVTLGVCPDMIIPLCFEKSVVTPIVMIAVMKAGGASVLLDPSQPEERLRSIVQQMETVLCLTSEDNHGLTSRLTTCRTEVVRWRSFPFTDTARATSVLPTVQPSSKLFVVFTSGSTGTPKGVIVTHSGFSSAIRHQQPMNGHVASSRCLDFASYAFDAAWSNMLHTLTSGGCLCIPSDSDRRGALNDCVRRFRITIVNLTPSVASLLSPDSMRMLQTLVVGGEALPPRDAARWSALVQLKNGYGPSECTPTATLTDINADHATPDSIGRGIGTVTWVVRPGNESQLSPLGEIGELLLEGPLVGPGYLGRPDKTSAAFVEDPQWLLEGMPPSPGRRGRLYKTGDLVRYTRTGELVFLGRADTQVKIRGQRVELTEVEHHVSTFLTGYVNAQVAAEVVTPRDSDSSIIVVFLRLDQMNVEDSQLAVQQAAVCFQDKLAAQLPSYMLPTAYIAIAQMPMTATGKLDRRRLRQIAASLTPSEIAARSPRQDGHRLPSTIVEQQLRMLWASTLGIDAGVLSADDNFMRIGGDSIAAIKLAEAAQEQGLPLTFVDVFREPRLSAQAKLIRIRAGPESTQVPEDGTTLNKQ